MENKIGIDKELWEKTEAKEVGEYESLKLGGHVVKIVSAERYEGLTGNVSLKICVDISGKDEQKDYFKNIYDNNTSSDKKWSTAATRYLSLKEENLGYLKGFITALEKSNKDFKFDLNKGWDQLVALFCAGVFGLEEYEDNDKKIKRATKLVNFRSIDKLDEIKIPRVKLIDGSYMDYEEYKNSDVMEAKKIFGDSTVEIKVEDLPF